MSGSYTGFPIANVNIPSLPDLGGVTDASMLVGERAGTGRFAASALRAYVLSGTLTVTDTLFFSSSGMSLSTGADYSIWTLDGSNYDIIWNRHTGLLQYRRGTDGLELWSVDEAGNMTTLGLYTVGGEGISYHGVPSSNHYHAFGWNGSHVTAFVDGTSQGTFAWTTDVVALHDQIGELQARINDLERDRAELQETLTTRIAALEARMGTGTAD